MQKPNEKTLHAAAPQLYESLRTLFEMLAIRDLVLNRNYSKGVYLEILTRVQMALLKAEGKIKQD